MTFVAFNVTGTVHSFGRIHHSIIPRKNVLISFSKPYKEPWWFMMDLGSFGGHPAPWQAWMVSPNNNTAQRHLATTCTVPNTGTQMEDAAMESAKDAHAVSHSHGSLWSLLSQPVTYGKASPHDGSYVRSLDTSPGNSMLDSSL